MLSGQGLNSDTIMPSISPPAARAVMPSWFNWKTILFIAFAARTATLLLVHNFTYPHFFEWGDISRKYLSGRGFSYYTINGADVPTAYMPPAYSFIIQPVFRALGDGPPAYILLQVTQLLFGVLLVYLVYRITRIACDENTALVAAALAAGYPPFIYLPSEMHSINFYIVITLAALYYLFLFLEVEPKQSYVVYAALLLGVLLYFRAEALALPFLYASLLLYRSRRYWKSALILILLPLFLLTPWTVRNYRTFNSMVLTTTSGGINLWYGHNQQATGTQREPWPSGKVVTPDAALQSRINALPPTADYELRLSALYHDEAIKFIRTHPAREAELLALKLFYFWTIDWNHPKARHFIYAAPTLLLVAVFWLGIAVNGRDLFGRYLILTVTLLFTNLIALVFFVLPRYRLVVEPIMILFSAGAIVWIWNALIALGTRPAEPNVEQRSLVL